MSIRSHAGQVPKISASAYIDPDAVVIGDVEIGAGSSVWPMTVIRGDIHRIRIGAKTSVQDGSVLHVTHAGPYNPDGFPLIIGDEVTIGHKVMLHGCTIHDGSLIGIGAIVLDGAVIGASSLVAAGSLISPGMHIPPRSLVMGSPGRVKRSLTEEECRNIHSAAGNYIHYQENYRINVKMPG
jgi:carbonic anhydrase/acetyltransferase-like protein (isoleucine patch superfamily)